jgi:DnaJ-class molecular chaperone
MINIAVLAVLVFAGWRISLWLWPFAPCRRCSGNGKNDGSNRKRWGYCRKCGGSGRRERLGRRLFMRTDR